jgi:hypothetical protein
MKTLMHAIRTSNQNLSMRGRETPLSGLDGGLTREDRTLVSYVQPLVPTEITFTATYRAFCRSRTSHLVEYPTYKTCQSFNSGHYLTHPRLVDDDILRGGTSSTSLYWDIPGLLLNVVELGGAVSRPMSSVFCRHRYCLLGHGIVRYKTACLSREAPCIHARVCKHLLRQYSGNHT